MQELTFTYEPKDYSNYNKDSLTIKRIVKYILKVNTIPFVILALIMALFFTVGLFGSVYLGHWLFYVIFIVAFVISYLLAVCIGITSQFLLGGIIIQRQQKGIAKDVKLIINDNTIMFDNGSIQSVYKWNSIKDIYNKKHNFIIFIADVQALIIPKRIFSSEEEIDNCWKHLQDYYDDARNGIK